MRPERFSRRADGFSQPVERFAAASGNYSLRIHGSLSLDPFRVMEPGTENRWPLVAIVGPTASGKCHSTSPGASKPGPIPSESWLTRADEAGSTENKSVGSTSAPGAPSSTSRPTYARPSRRRLRHAIRKTPKSGSPKGSHSFFSCSRRLRAKALVIAASQGFIPPISRSRFSPVTIRRTQSSIATTEGTFLFSSPVVR